MKNSKEIMTRAHALTRETLRAYPSADYRATLRAALRIVWSESGSETDPRAAWERMTGEEQFAALRAMVWHRARVCRAECDRMGNPRANNYRFLDEEHDGDLQIVNDAFIRMTSALDRNAETPDPAPLSIILARCCDRAAQYLRRTEHRHASALRLDAILHEDGVLTLREYIDTEDNHSARRAPSTEAETLTRIAIDTACVDDIDRAIIKYRRIGLTMEECGERVGMTKRAVKKRLDNIRARMEEQSRDPYEADLIAYRIRSRINHA